MTLVTIDLGDVAGGHDPDDHVVIRAEAFRESTGGGITSTAEVKIYLVDGVGQAEVEPGPVVVSFRCRAVADTREKRGVVPDEGPVDLGDVIAGDFVYTPPVVSQVALDAQRAEDAADSAETVAAAFGSLEGVQSAVDGAASSAAAADGSATAAAGSATAAASSASAAAGYAGSATSDATSAATSAGAASTSATNAASAETAAAGHSSDAQDAATAAASSASAAAGSATAADSAAARAENVAESTHWEGDRLSVMGQMGPSLTGRKGDKGDPGDGAGDVLWSELNPVLDGKASVSHDHTIGQVAGLQDELEGLEAALDDKASTDHTHPEYAESSRVTALEGSQPIIVSSLPSSPLPGRIYLVTG